MWATDDPVFKVYLHPSPSFCSAECLNTEGGVSTFHNHAGFYGDAETKGTEHALYRYGAPGSGRCTICGGSESSATANGGVGQLLGWQACRLHVVRKAARQERPRVNEC